MNAVVDVVQAIEILWPVDAEMIGEQLQQHIHVGGEHRLVIKQIGLVGGLVHGILLFPGPSGADESEQPADPADLWPDDLAQLVAAAQADAWQGFAPVGFADLFPGDPVGVHQQVQPRGDHWTAPGAAGCSGAGC
ncbi:MAG: hypothetical protein CMI02_04990 [Oceanospirillaceae bacterium]|nr:hypothetical protein [Oceanospirillaceae bacterium]